MDNEMKITFKEKGIFKDLCAVFREDNILTIQNNEKTLLQISGRSLNTLQSGFDPTRVYFFLINSHIIGIFNYKKENEDESYIFYTKVTNTQSLALGNLSQNLITIAQEQKMKVEKVICRKIIHIAQNGNILFFLENRTNQGYKTMIVRISDSKGLIDETKYAIRNNLIMPTTTFNEIDISRLVEGEFKVEGYDIK